MLLTFSYSPIVVDISDLVAETTIVKRRAQRVNVQLPDSATAPCVLEVEVIPYARLEDGSYGKELTNSMFKRYTRTLTVSPLRLVDGRSGRILASRFAADGSLRPDTDWQADVARLTASTTIEAKTQADWFNELMEQGLPAPINAFVVQYIMQADLSGDLN